jgi:hypothetical protein
VHSQFIPSRISERRIDRHSTPCWGP